MEEIFFLQLAKDSGCGLCNQIYALTGCIEYAIHTKKYKIIVADLFLREINTNKYAPLSNILNMPCYQSFLLSEYRILLFDKNNLKISIDNIFLDGKEIKSEILTKYFTRDGLLYIPKNSDVFESKNILRIDMYLNQFPVSFLYDLRERDRDIVFHTSPAHYTYKPSPCLYLGGSKNPEQFIKLLQNTPFHDHFHSAMAETAESILTPFIDSHAKTLPRINLIHLRMEEDAIQSFSKENNVSSDVFERKMGEKYIELIQRYIDPHDVTLVISGKYDNSVVIDFLSTHQYRFVHSIKRFPEREENAIHDMLFFKLCNHVFIGVYESSFSYTLMYKLFSKQEHIFSVIFQMNCPAKKEKIFTKQTPLSETQTF
jgi:hypothetical protein